MIKLEIKAILKAAGLCVLLLFASCKGVNRKYIIPERKFVSFLVDLHIAEAIGVQSRNVMDPEFEIDSASLYGSVFRKYNVSQAMLDSTLLFYGRKPRKFKKIYETVSTRLLSLEQELLKEEKALEEARTDVLWKSDSVYVFREGGDKIEFIVPLKGPGLYTVSANVKMMPDDAALDPRMSVYFWRQDSTADGDRLHFMEVRYLLRNGTDRTYKSVKRLDSTDYTHLRGFVSNYSNADTFFRRNMVVKDIVVSKQIDPLK